MAIWQYTIELIPKEALLELGKVDFINFDDYENFDFWKDYSYEIKFFDSLTVEFKRGKSWSDEIILYGESESTCIRFFMEDNKIVGVDIRIDFRGDYSGILNSVIEFCNLNGFFILDNLEILQLNATFIIYHIENSKQFFTYKKLFG